MLRIKVMNLGSLFQNNIDKLAQYPPVLNPQRNKITLYLGVGVIVRFCFWNFRDYGIHLYDHVSLTGTLASNKVQLIVAILDLAGSFVLVTGIRTLQALS